MGIPMKSTYLIKSLGARGQSLWSDDAEAVELVQTAQLRCEYGDQVKPFNFLIAFQGRSILL